MTIPPGASADGAAIDVLHARLASEWLANGARRAAFERAVAPLRAAAWPAWLAEARAHATAGAPAIAAMLLGEAAMRWPSSIELRLAWSQSLQRAQRIDEALAVLRDVLRTHPHHEPATLALAYQLRQCGRIEAACDLVSALWERQGCGVEATLKAATFFDECRRPRRTIVVCERALAAGSADPRIHAALGDAATTLGVFAEARMHLRAALDAGIALEDWSGLLLRLATTQRYDDPQHPDVVRFRHAWSDAVCAPPVRIGAGFALAKACLDVGQIAEAVAVLRQAHAMQRGLQAWDPVAADAFVAAQIAAPLPPRPEPVPAAADFVPVFVVGLPRTGTSLVEERLSRHPQVRGRGELDWLPFLAHELSARRRSGDPEALRQAAATYLAHLRQDDAPARWYIDKNPHNFRHLGLIAALFPDARVIHCVRDRRDTAVSIWTQYFAHPDAGYAGDLRDIAAVGRGHDRLMRHWRESLDLPILEIAYERLVEDPDATLGTVAAFLGLPEHAVRADADVPETAIGTASAWQARQPVHRGSVGRWRQFEPFLPELATLFVEPDDR